MSESNGFEVVERPGRASQRKPPGKWGELALALIAVMPRAIRIPMDGRARDSVVTSLSYALRTRGYNSHTRLDGKDHLIVWAEKLDG